MLSDYDNTTLQIFDRLYNLPKNIELKFGAKIGIYCSEKLFLILENCGINDIIHSYYECNRGVEIIEFSRKNRFAKNKIYTLSFIECDSNIKLI